MPDFSLQDPFTQVYDAIWAVLETNSTFKNLVKPGNRIKYTSSDETPKKRETLNSDFPEVEIKPSDGDIQYSFTSSSVLFNRSFDLILTAGSQRANAVLFPLEWIILRIFFDAKETLGLDFVAKVDLTAWECGNEEQDEKRGTPSWVSILTIEVSMAIARTDVTTE